jgi:hypothetical protein
MPQAEGRVEDARDPPDNHPTEELVAELDGGDRDDGNTPQNEEAFPRYMFTPGITPDTLRNFLTLYTGEGNLPNVSELRYLNPQAITGAESFDVVKQRDFKIVLLPINFAQGLHHAGAFSGYIFDQLKEGDFRFQPVETDFSHNVFEQETVAKFFSGYVAAIERFGARTPSKTTPTDMMAKLSDIIYKRVHNQLCSTLGNNELLAPCQKDMWVGKVDIELRNLLQSATAQIDEVGTKLAFKLLNLFDLVFKEVVRVNRERFLNYFRLIPVDKTWMRRQLIKGKTVRRKIKGRFLDQWQDEANLTISDIIWLSNSEKQDVSRLLGITWVKAFDDALQRFESLDKPVQHDCYKSLLQRFERLKTEQTNFVRQVSAKVGVRKKLLSEAGLLGDLKKKDPYKSAISFITKPARERILKDADGTVKEFETARFNKCFNIQNFALLLKTPLEGEESEPANIADILPSAVFEGRFFSSTEAMRSAQSLINSARRQREKEAAAETEQNLPDVNENPFSPLGDESDNDEYQGEYDPGDAEDEFGPCPPLIYGGLGPNNINQSREEPPSG